MGSTSVTIDVKGTPAAQVEIICPIHEIGVPTGSAEFANALSYFNSIEQNLLNIQNNIQNGLLSFAAASTGLTAGQVVYLDSLNNAYPASYNDGTGTLAVGIAQTSELSGDAVMVQYGGNFTDPSWSWIPGLDVYLGVNGSLTQVPPTDGSLVLVGTAITSTTIALANTVQPNVIMDPATTSNVLRDLVYDETTGNYFALEGTGVLYVGPTEPPDTHPGFWVQTEADFSRAIDIKFNGGPA